MNGVTLNPELDQERTKKLRALKLLSQLKMLDTQHLIFYRQKNKLWLASGARKIIKPLATSTGFEGNQKTRKGVRELIEHADRYLNGP